MEKKTIARSYRKITDRLQGLLSEIGLLIVNARGAWRLC